MLEKTSTGSRERCFDTQSTVTSQFWVSLTDVYITWVCPNKQGHSQGNVNGSRIAFGR
jgi:hypothetical protein